MSATTHFFTRWRSFLKKFPWKSGCRIFLPKPPTTYLKSQTVDPFVQQEWSWGHLSWVCLFVNYFAMSTFTCFWRPWCQTFNLQLCFLQQFGNKVRGSQFRGKAIRTYVYPVSQVNNTHFGIGGFEAISKSRNSCTKTCKYNIWDPFPTLLGIHLSVIFRFFRPPDETLTKNVAVCITFDLFVYMLFVSVLHLFGNVQVYKVTLSDLNRAKWPGDKWSSTFCFF